MKLKIGDNVKIVSKEIRDELLDGRFDDEDKIGTIAYIDLEGDIYVRFDTWGLCGSFTEADLKLVEAR